MTQPPDDLRAALSDRYRLERELGHGGMATVYLAHDIRHDRPVALKVLHPELAAALGSARFEREIRLAARLQHPHILTVHDSGEDAGRLWFTMPYVEGESLRSRLRRERQLPVDEAVRIVVEAARALDHAHRQGVVHRDIKPENILLTRDGDALVADFGIARALGARDQVTETGMAIGTPAYMSPEQAGGESALDPRTDVYSLATVLYELLAGETPFTGPTAQVIFARRMTGDAPLVRSARASTPPGVEAAIARALAVVPADRFGTAAEFARALGAGAAGTSGDHAPSAPAGQPGPRAARQFPRWLSRKPALAAALGLLALAGAGAVTLARRSAEPSGLRAAQPPGTSAPVRIAVLPFINLGDSGDAYFASGVADAVRGKLTEIRGLEVIARSSSVEYEGTTKSPRDIARELGVDYLLTGTVRWARAADGSSRVQVNPELVEIGDGTARSRWQQPFDSPLTDVFAVQGEIAGRVAVALDVAIGLDEHRGLTERPTRDLAAWDAYLRAEAITGIDTENLRRRMDLYGEAIGHDSLFGMAWARLAEVAALFNLPGAEIRPIRDAGRRALERAVALAPDAIETIQARDTWEAYVNRDREAARLILAEGLARHPGHPDLLRNLGIHTSMLPGGADTGLVILRRALELNPRSLVTARALGGTYIWLRRPADARAAYQQVLGLSPADLRALHGLASTFIQEGDLPAARRVLASAPASVDRQVLAAYFSVYDDLFWVPDSAGQELALKLPLAAPLFGGDRGSWALVRAQIHRYRGDSAAARAWGDTASAAFQSALAAVEDKGSRALLALSLAYAGRYEEAVREGERAASGPVTPGERNAPYAVELLARIHAMAGDREQAIDLLERLLRMTDPYTPAWLRIDPTWASLRGDPRFERLVAGG